MRTTSAHLKSEGNASRHVCSTRTGTPTTKQGMTCGSARQQARLPPTHTTVFHIAVNTAMPVLAGIGVQLRNMARLRQKTLEDAAEARAR